MTPTAGLVLGGRYRLLEPVAGGGMGEVWRADDERLGRPVAVKLLRSELAVDDDVRARFRDEARHAAGLDHPGIATVHDYAESDGTTYLVLELVDGRPLSAVLAEGGALGVDRTLDVIAQTGVALQAAHEAGIVHRDVKPGNLLLRPDGRVVVTDFGIARALSATTGRTQVGTILGTAEYLAPEVARGEPATAASDVYALGCVGYECLAGRRPFTGDTPLAVASAHLHGVPPPLPEAVPRDVARLVLSCLAKDPARRPASAAELARQASALRAAQTAAPTSVLPLAAGVAGGAVAAGGVAAGGSLAAAAAAGEVAGDVAGGRPRWASDQPGQRRTRTALVLGGAAAVLLGFLVLHSCGLGPRPAARPAARTEPVTVALDPAAYVGRPAGSVVRQLRALGLRPHRVVVPAGDAAGGTVVAVSPSGALARGTVVQVSVAAAPTGGDGGDGGD